MTPSGGGQPPPGSALPVALQRLAGDARQFWSDAAHRERMLRDILDARGRQARARALQSVDDAVTQGMAALGFQRAPIPSLSLVTPNRRDIAGLKYSTCDLQISRPAIQRELRPGGAPDAIVETWIHESVHGRRFPWGPNLRTEFAFRGFEEGLAEGVTRLVSRQAGFVPGPPTYGRYVQTYEELGQTLRVHPETIYRCLYRLANGSVMDSFASEIDAIRQATGESALTVAHRDRLQRVAKREFDARLARGAASAREGLLFRRAWQRALR